MKNLTVLMFLMLALIMPWSGTINAIPSPIEVVANFFKCLAVHLSDQCLDLAYKCLLLTNPLKCFKTLKCAELSFAQCAIIE
ncbi:uncharacterized protein LOC142597434 [Dermatophagoides farinae]|uniref:Uncharacterized protein n=1 Tax=Dermatophagoides farinae TaxID=6954 RepID=A0A922LBQ0_DERFA|nr:hypothetical protein DERF_002102 [Dermatophagoides farinae]